MPGRRDFEKEGRTVLFRSGVKPMELEDTRVGTRVLVRSDYKKPHRQGLVGTIQKRYGTTSWKRRGSQPTAPSGGGSSGSLTSGDHSPSEGSPCSFSSTAARPGVGTSCTQ